MRSMDARISRFDDETTQGRSEVARTVEFVEIFTSVSEFTEWERRGEDGAFVQRTTNQIRLQGR